MDRYYGLIYGQCIGDAFGARYEFLTSQDAIKKVTDDTKNNFVEILGEGFFKVEPGQITDDSEMALSLFKTLVKYKKYKRSKVAKAYIKWYNTKPVDIGKTISKSLFTRKMSRNKEDMINISSELNFSSLSNGTMMRISPLALLSKNTSLKKLEKIVYKECELTHPHPVIKEASWLYILALVKALKGSSKEEIYNALITECKTPKVFVVLREAQIRPEPTVGWVSSEKVDFIKTDSASSQGYFGVALQNALYELLSGTDFYTSMINIVKRGGDTDTNCAIAGSLLGAYYGLSKLPVQWVNTIKNYSGKRSNLYSTQNLEQSIDTLLN